MINASRSMASLWFDLLCLHGHITDLQWLRDRTDPARKKVQSEGVGDVRNYLRRCLGIGDGVMRTQ